MNPDRHMPRHPQSAVRNLHDALDALDTAVGQLAAFVDQVPPLLPGLETHLRGNGTCEALIAAVSEAARLRVEAGDLQRYLDANATALAELNT